MLFWMCWSFWLFFFVPLFDIWVSLSLYGGLGATPMLCFFAGTWLLAGWIYYRQTDGVVRGALTAFLLGRVAGDEIRESYGFVMAAALLVAPGVITDLFGFVLLTPGLRRYLMGVIFGGV